MAKLIERKRGLKERRRRYQHVGKFTGGWAQNAQTARNVLVYDPRSVNIAYKYVVRGLTATTPQGWTLTDLD